MAGTYLKVTEDQIKSTDIYGSMNALEVANSLSKLPYNQTGNITGGAADSTVVENVFVAPTKGEITDFKIVMNTIQTGTGNTPSIQLYNVTQSLAITDAETIALAKSVSDVVSFTLTDNVSIAQGDVIAVNVVTPDQTITVAIKALCQIEWHSVV